MILRCWGWRWRGGEGGGWWLFFRIVRFLIWGWWGSWLGCFSELYFFVVKMERVVLIRGIVYGRIGFSFWCCLGLLFWLSFFRWGSLRWWWGSYMGCSLMLCRLMLCLRVWLWLWWWGWRYNWGLGWGCWGSWWEGSRSMLWGWEFLLVCLRYVLGRYVLR